MNNNELNREVIKIEYQETYNEMEMKPHFHNSYEIIFILEGYIELKVKNKTYTANSNSIIFISNLEAHELKVINYPYKRYFLLFKPEYLQTILNEPVLISIFKHRPEHFNHIINLSNMDGLKLSKDIKVMYEEAVNDNDFKEITLRSYISLLFISLYRNYSSSFPLTTMNKSMETILKIQKYIEDHYIENINLKELSKLFFTDMYYISHLFRKVTGFSFKEYLILQRISKARELLFYTTDDVTQVGLNSGFNNVNHFIRIFKKFEDLTPYQYRKKFRK